MKIVKAIGMCALVLALVVPAAAQDKMITIGISQIVEHPALDAARQGFIDALAKHGYVEGKNVTYDIQIAQGNMATANSIAKALVGKRWISSTASPPHVPGVP